MLMHLKAVAPQWVPSWVTVWEVATSYPIQRRSEGAFFWVKITEIFFFLTHKHWVIMHSSLIHWDKNLDVVGVLHPTFSSVCKFPEPLTFLIVVRLLPALRSHFVPQSTWMPPHNSVNEWGGTFNRLILSLLCDRNALTFTFLMIRCSETGHSKHGRSVIV